MKKTTVDPTICIGCALCAATCPKSYRMRDDMISEALEIQLDDAELIEMSVADCPVEAISYTDNTPS